MSLAPGMQVPADHTARPDVTFDDFLWPHKSGKGLALPPAENSSEEQSPVKRPNSLQRFSMMSRMSLGGSSPTLATVEEQVTDGAAVDLAGLEISPKKISKARHRLSKIPDSVLLRAKK